MHQLTVRVTKEVEVVLLAALSICPVV
jgi:hypothetical protein